MGCDMCGEEGRLFVTMIEGTEMQLCNQCKQYGEVKRAVPTAQEAAAKERVFQQRQQHRSRHDNKDVFEMIVDGFGSRIKQAREAMNKKQEELAKMLAMKESQLHKYESEQKRPDLDMARKLERALGITLVESYTEENKSGAPGATGSGPLTIADLIKKKK